MQVTKCPRCNSILREVHVRSSFVMHAGCIRCNILYVLWGTSMTRCLTPVSCAGPTWRFTSESPATDKGKPKLPAPRVNA